MFVRRARQALAATILVVALVVLSACAAVPTAGTSSGGGSGTSSDTATPADAAKPLGLAIGTSANYDGLKVTVVSVKSGKKDWAGKATVAVAVQYENGTKDTATFNEFDWKLEDKDGARTQDLTFFNSASKGLGSGDLAPGGVKKGTVYYAGSLANVTKVVYTENMFGGEESLATWTVK